MKIVVIGGTGLIGSKLVNKLREHGNEAVAASPNSGVNTLTGEGLAEVLKGASVVVDVSNSPSWEDAAVLKFLDARSRTPDLRGPNTVLQQHPVEYTALIPPAGPYHPPVAEVRAYAHGKSKAAIFLLYDGIVSGLHD